MNTAKTNLTSYHNLLGRTAHFVGGPYADRPDPIRLNNRTTLGDHVIAAPRDPRRAFGALASKLGPASHTRMREIADATRRASRIFLDPSAVRAAARISVQPPSVILRNLPRALPPGELAWVEWDEMIRVKELLAAGYSDDTAQVADRVGLLLEARHGMLSVGVISLHTTEIPLIFHTFGFWWGCKPEFMPEEDLGITLAVHNREREDGYHSLALGERWHDQNRADGEAYHALADRVAYHWFGIPAMDDHSKLQSRDKLAFQGAISVTGDMRFLLALLILMNTETILDDPWTSAGVRAPANSARLRTPGNVFRTLRVELPHERLTERLVNYTPPTIPTGRRHRDHAVIPHVARSRRRGSPLCEHEFDREEVPHFCILCGYHEWPVRAHRRGDPALGTVHGPRLLAARGGNR